MKRIGTALLGLLLAALAISALFSLFITPGTNIGNIATVIGVIVVGALSMVVVAYWWFQRR